ncbi:hypothetical protein [Nonomuraea sp. NPDC049309]|uniref:hypothetical protein n=1 Tax=Nonomuraea sp. NPDC049309 TaxID=3364350 RepID=UPI003710EB9F
MALLVVLSAVTACQSSGSAPKPLSTETLAPATPTPTPTTDRDAVLAAYRELYRAGPRAEQVPADERRAILAQVATQPLLDTMLKGIDALRASGRVTWGQPVLHVFDVQVQGDRAALHDCQDARKAGQADDRTGKRLTHGMPRTHMVAALVKEPDGVWRVAKVDQLEEPCSPAA